MPELGPYGSVRGARGNSRPYRDPGSIASVGLSWHVGFTPDPGRIAATQRTDASGHNETFRRKTPVY